MKTIKLFVLFALFATSFLLAQTPSQVNFDLNINPTIDSGMNYNNYVAGDTGPENSFVIGFEIKINSIDGTPLNIDPIAAFCSELEQPIGVNNYTFEASPLKNLASSTGGQAGTASTGIPATGIGALRAARLQYFFDQNYTSVALTGWTQKNLHAFQLGVWEITHDIDLDLSNNSGFNYVGVQTGTNSIFKSESIDLAQTWLDEVYTFNPSANYTSSQYKFWSLIDNSGQDVILATLLGSSSEETLTNLIVVPEPNYLLVCLALAFLVVFVRKKS